MEEILNTSLEMEIEEQIPVHSDFMILESKNSIKKVDHNQQYDA
jgi:hypothetical protein